MKTKIGTSFGLALLLAIGVIATMLALGMFTSSKVQAATVSSTSLFSVANTPVTPGDTAAYTVTFKNKDELASNSGQLWIYFDASITVPSTIEKERVTISTSGGQVSNPAFDPEIEATEAGDTVVKLTVGDTNLTTTTVADALVAFDDTSTNDGHIVKFSTLAGIKNSTTPSTTKAWVRVSTDSGTNLSTACSAAGQAQCVAVYRYVILDDTADARGKVVTVTGKGWDSGETATIFLDVDGGTVHTKDANDIVLGTSDATISGGAFTATFTVDTNFVVGKNTINAVDGTGTAANDGAQGARYMGQTFTLNGKISVAPTTASRGESVKVTLSDFGNGTVTAVTFGGIQATVDAGTTVANNSGSVTVTVPSTTALGTQQVTVSSSGEANRSTSITVGGLTMSVSPSTAVAKQAVTVSASGFTASGTIANDGLTVGGIVQDTLTNGNAETTVTADNSGNMVLTFKIPDDETTRTAGTHVVKITDSGNRIGEVNLTVPARSITIDPANGRRGSSFTVDGSGFIASTTVTITFLSGTTTSTIATTSADSSGSFSTTGKVPTTAGIPSTNTVTAASACTAGTPTGNICTQISSTASQKVPGASITIEPTSSASGTNIAVTGVDFPGFVAMATLNIGDVSALPSPAPATDADGSISLTALVPALATGSHSVTATVGTGTTAVTATTSFTVVAAAATTTVTTTDTEVTFADSIAADTLVRVWQFDNATKEWAFFDPRPAFADANTYGTASSADIVWINFTEDTTFQGTAYTAGWSVVSLD